MLMEELLPNPGGGGYFFCVVGGGAAVESPPDKGQSVWKMKMLSSCFLDLKISELLLPEQNKR